MAKKTPQEIITQIFKQYHKELSAEIEKADSLLQMKRIYDSGTVLEIALKNQLLKLLPSYVGVTRGIIFDSECKEYSEEIDLILYDKRYLPGLVVSEISEDVVSYISIDTVFGVISVKKSLDRDSLKNAISNIQSVYSLNRKEIRNQFHYDLAFSDEIEYKKGLCSNNVFSCIVAYENKLLNIVENGIQRKRTVEESQAYFDKLFQEPWIDNTNVDIIFTVDGSIFSPFALDHSKKAFVRTASTHLVGKPKKVMKPIVVYDEEHKRPLITHHSDLVLGYSIDLEHPEKALGQFILFLQVYAVELVKSSPNFLAMFKHFLEGVPVQVPTVARTFEEIINRQDTEK